MTFFTRTIYILITVTMFTKPSNAQVFSENFESGIPNTWAIFDNGVGTTNNWTTNNSNDHGIIAQITYDCTVASNSEDWLVTPLITPNNANNILRFFLSSFDPTDFGSVMTIRVSTGSQTNLNDFTTIHTILEPEAPMTLSPIQVDLSAYIDQPIHIAFVLTQNCGDTWQVDLVEVRPECNIDLTVTASGSNVLTANQAGASYEWIACNNTLSGDTTNQSITVADANQRIRVKITTSDGCFETSPCYSFNTLGINDNEFENPATLYPNPAHNSFKITNLSDTKTNVQIYDILGKKMIEIFDYHENDIDVSNWEKGMYIVKINGQNRAESIKLLIK